MKRIIALLCAVVLLLTSLSTVVGLTDEEAAEVGLVWNEEEGTWQPKDMNPDAKLLRCYVQAYTLDGNGKEIKVELLEKIIGQGARGYGNEDNAVRKVFDFNFHTSVEYGKIIPIPKTPNKVMVRDGFSINRNTDKTGVGQDDTIIIDISKFSAPAEGINLTLTNKTTGKVMEIKDIPEEKEERSILLFKIKQGGENDCFRGVVGDVFSLEVNYHSSQMGDEPIDARIGVNTAKEGNEYYLNYGETRDWVFKEGIERKKGEIGFETFERKNTYHDYFVDVPKDSWYYEGVKTMYELSYMIGTSGNTFSPQATMTKGDFVILASRMNAWYHDRDIGRERENSTWKTDCLDYATGYFILPREDNITWLASSDEQVTRKEAILVMSRMFPNETYVELPNKENADLLPTQSAKKLYKAGVLAGGESPEYYEQPMTKAEIATLMSRLIKVEQRLP